MPVFQKSHIIFVSLREVHAHAHEGTHTQTHTHTINSERGKCLLVCCELYVGYNYKCFSHYW